MAAHTGEYKPWDVTISSICNQMGIKYFRIRLNLLGLHVLGNHPSKFASDRFSG